MSYVAVEGCTLTFAAATSATIQITSSPSQKVKAGGNFVYSGQIDFVVSNYTGAVTNGTGSGSITPSIAQKVKADGKLVLCNGDKVQVLITGTQGSSTVTIQDVLTITDAGQDKVEAK